jgi:hypothetical protein
MEGIEGNNGWKEWKDRNKKVGNRRIGNGS